MSAKDFLAGEHVAAGQPRPRARCSVCANAEMTADIDEWIDQHRTGKTRVSLGRFYRKYIMPTYGFPASVNTVRDHVLFCRGYDPTQDRDDGAEGHGGE